MPSLGEGVASNVLYIDVSFVLKSFYLGTAGAILVAYKIPILKDRFLAYGARSAASKTEHGAVFGDVRSQEKSPSLPFTHGFGPLNAIPDFVASLQVPHGWFLSFYFISVASSMLWQFQLLTRGFLYQNIADWTHRQHASMSLDQIALCWFLMAFQGTRRLWECIMLTRPSHSKMWVFHWLAGVLFYFATGISIWIEGIPLLESTAWTFDEMQLSAPSPCLWLCLAAFLIASIVQNRAHAHLASLKKYTLPSHPAFEKILCPHYTAECVLYLAVTFLAAPQGHLVNGTMLCATLFVVVNLGITADISKAWAMEKFGEERIKGKWRMVPGLW